MNALRWLLALLAALVLGGCAGSAGNPNELLVNNDSANTVEMMVWAGDALPKDPEAPLKQDAALTGTIEPGSSWRVDLPARTDAGASSVVATVAVRAQGEDLGSSQWINVEGQRPWIIRVFGQAPNLRVARVIQQNDERRMQRTVGPRPPSVTTGGFGTAGPQR